MGDGVSDLGRRGELGPREQEEYVLDGIRRGGGKMDIHKRSVLYAGSADAIDRLKQRGDIKVSSPPGAPSWITLELVKKHLESPQVEGGEYLVQNGWGRWEICQPSVFSRTEGGKTIYELAWATRDGRYFSSGTEARDVRPMPRAEEGA